MSARSRRHGTRGPGVSKPRSRWKQVPDELVEKALAEELDACNRGRTVALETAEDRKEKPRTPGGFSRFDPVNKAKAKQRDGVLNKVEKERAQVLEGLRLAGKIQGFLTQAITFQLGNRATYRPDFVVVMPDGLVVCEEIKGERGWKLDNSGRIKWKWAAEELPIFSFQGVVKEKGGGWMTEIYIPRKQWPPTRPRDGGQCAK